MTLDTRVSLARDAYVFTYPLVMNYRTMYMQAIKGDRAFGKWLHLGLSSPADTDIVTPNNDTPYSYAWVDLRAEPWVLTMPKIEKERFYTSQWDDLWGYVLDNPGSVNRWQRRRTAYLFAVARRGRARRPRESNALSAARAIFSARSPAPK